MCVQASKCRCRWCQELHHDARQHLLDLQGLLTLVDSNGVVMRNCVYRHGFTQPPFDPLHLGSQVLLTLVDSNGMVTRNCMYNYIQAPLEGPGTANIEVLDDEIEV